MPRERFESVLDLLKQSLALRNLGYNERHAEDCPRQRDDTGVTALQYRRMAVRLENRINAFLNKVGAHITAKQIETIALRGGVLSDRDFQHLTLCRACANEFDQKVQRPVRAALVTIAHKGRKKK